jgi:hypothetical protein
MESTGVAATEETFAALDEKAGHPGTDPTAEELQYPLVAWYESVRNKPLSSLTIDDVCIACRQGVHLPYLLPLAAQFLRDDIQAGHQYDGELIHALTCHIDEPVWQQNPGVAAEIMAIVADSVGRVDYEEVRQDAVKLLRVLRVQAR